MDNNPYKTPLYREEWQEEWQDGWEKGYAYGVSLDNTAWFVLSCIQLITILFMITVRLLGL